MVWSGVVDMALIAWFLFTGLAVAILFYEPDDKIAFWSCLVIANIWAAVGEIQ
jgi:hypothetical protein